MFRLFSLLNFLICCTSIVKGSSNKVYDLVHNWNSEISDFVDLQNKVHDIDLPLSMQRASNSNLLSARKLEYYVATNHSKILCEIKQLIGKGYHGLPMSFIDSVQHSLFANQQRWTNIWLKLHDETFDHILLFLPTLQGIVADMGDDLLLLQVSIFWPPVELPPHNGINKGTYRYLYPLQIPHDISYYDPLNEISRTNNVMEGSTGMNIDGKTFHWTRNEGVIFDDTLTHFAWNTTPEPRILLFGDLYREFPEEIDKENRRISQKVCASEHVKSIQSILRKQATFTKEEVPLQRFKPSSEHKNSSAFAHPQHLLIISQITTLQEIITQYNNPFEMQTKKQQWRRMSTNTLIVRKRSSSLAPPSSATNLLLKEDDEMSIPVLRAFSHDSYMNKIASFPEHTTTKAKSVRFSPKVHVVLVPQAKEYHDAKLGDFLWWDYESYGYFKQSAVDEIVTYMVSNNCPNMTAKQVLAAIYSCNNNGTCQDAFLSSDIAESSCAEDCEISPESLPSPQPITQLVNATITTDKSLTTSKTTNSGADDGTISVSTEASHIPTVPQANINNSNSGSCFSSGSGSTGSMLERLASYSASQSACNNDMYEKLASLSMISCSY